MPDIKYEIKETLAVLSESSKGWTKELNLVSWNDKEPKYDIREWSPEHDKMGKGVTLSVEDMKMLRDVLNGMKILGNDHEDNNCISKSRVIIADVLYTNSDETLYVLNGESKYAEKYKADSMKETIKILENDNWLRCGKVNRPDDSMVDMLGRDQVYIAIWEE